MKPNLAIQAFLGLYILIFFLYLFGPLVIMSITAFNSAEFPAITPWECFSFRSVSYTHLPLPTKA